MVKVVVGSRWWAVSEGGAQRYVVNIPSFSLSLQDQILNQTHNTLLENSP